MPELPEVQTVLDGLTEVLHGVSITGLICYYPGTVITDPALGDEPFPARLSQAQRRGKYMILHLDNSTSMIIHLRMTGKLVYEPHPEEPHKHERARIQLSTGDALRFIDPRTFGKITLVNTALVEKYLPDLGPEPLSQDFSPSYLKRVLKGRTAPIKNLLLDQRIVAGLGNIYVCELLFRSGIRPDRPGVSIFAKEQCEIVKHTKEVLLQALKVGGTSISDYRRIDDKTGQFQHFLQVYQKRECPLGHAVQNLKLAGRSSFFCPECQK
ncbi:MAG: bifunctional DNA-formamidopyrimidine glycosylase/DNA-(apurinic or apyrimidinic site) lyase [Candidatus Cloacimonadaceae bacterium]|jgi:formamidopyrimidine-DNA glycosylase|nr:bifunctional DNA-formamidopyrimidine glycosylase/DNA-(apurinic or apyrimidinic site) lyase [Candidatus Cloacimonadota bacterium]MCK9178856.1 bifunctional DNA-formamidopyrimidine glycosylase/DNA-(apurinic or apyrimidinic site) lyase [Candidatus Cloacimonadota bacterium]MDD3103150.1 bifunctional DNA-formamidopyrimidine glycosylase/DNA-(apurinic or apyrimidinic site) lyase [Candidatus Cloacimonadota bacterium]MDD3532893.1 bifunctional DNA-formamidopyrimidine glycosylase/DNA-(apurinic or apyrimid